LGTKDSGIYVTADGWHVGGEIHAHHNYTGGIDVVDLTATTGSGGLGSAITVAHVTQQGPRDIRIELVDSPEVRAAAARLLGLKDADA
jgi:hypothetical protein